MYYFDLLAKLERQRKKCLKSFLPEPLLPLFQWPIWGASSRLWDIEFLVLDFETTGLNISRDNILSIGWVVIKNGQIHLDSACKIDVIATEKIKPETAVINHIVSQTLAHSQSIDQAMKQLVAAMQGRVLIAHSAAIERGFFHQYCYRVFNIASIALVWLDTMHIEQSLMRTSGRFSKSDYQLSSIRAEYGLPDYPGHDALIDAVATAELFLAQVKSVFGRVEPCLGQMARRS